MNLIRAWADSVRFLLSPVGRGMEPHALARPTEEYLTKNTFQFGGIGVPVKAAEADIIISGGKMSGKTTAMIPLMTSRIQGLIDSKKPFNVHAYTPKPLDFLPILKAVFEPQGVEVRATNPFLKDSWAWDCKLDLRNPPSIDEATVTLIKDNAKDSNPFFRQAAQFAMRGVFESLAWSHSGLWAFRHAVLILQSRELTLRVLERCPQTRYIAELLSDGQGVAGANVFGTILNETRRLPLVVAQIDQTPLNRRYSLEEAANRPNTIWVWGSDPRYNTTIEPWNACQIELMSHHLQIRPPGLIETCFFIDEFPTLNGGVKMPAIRKNLEVGRSAGVRNCIAVQTPAQVMAIYGQDEGDALLGQTHCCLVLRHSDSQGRRFWASRFGKERGFELKHSIARQTGGGRTTGNSSSRNTNWSTTNTVSQERFELERVTEDMIGNLPVGSYEDGIRGFAYLPFSTEEHPETGTPQPLLWKFHLTPEYIARNVPNPGPVEPYLKSLRPESSYTMKPMEPFEFATLDLEAPGDTADDVESPEYHDSNPRPARRRSNK